LWFWYVVAVILGFDAVVLLVLAIPVDAVLDLDVHGRPVLTARVKWFFGLVTFRPSGEKAEKKPSKPSGRPKRPKKPARKPYPGEMWARLYAGLDAFLTTGLFDEVNLLFVRLFRSFRIKELNGAFRAGLPDPAYTGMLYGYYMAVTMPFGWPWLQNVRVDPVFDELIFEGDLHAVVRLLPIKLVGAPVLFVFSLPVLRVVKKLLVSEWKLKRSRQKAAYPSAA
jgi:hypothetical protein